MGFVLKDEKATLEFGAKLAQIINESDNAALEFHLQGELGAGKTTLVRGILNALGWNGSVKSPTYTICEEYELNQFLVLHIDLYRIENEKELNSIGIFEYLESDKLCFIEWPHVLTKYINEKAIRIKINILDEFNREVEITNN